MFPDKIWLETDISGKNNDVLDLGCPLSDLGGNLILGLRLR